MRTLTLSFLFAISSLLAQAQTTDESTVDPKTGSIAARGAAVPERRGSFGWIGLLGLAGLVGAAGPALRRSSR